jgi:DNA-binding NtrC family response regulator
MDMKKFLEDIEYNLIKTTLTAFNGSIAQSAQFLNTKRSTLGEKINRMGISIEQIKVEKKEVVLYGDDEMPMLRISPIYEMKMNAILDSLKANQWSRKCTAEQLGISRRNLNYWISHAKKSGIDIPDYVENHSVSDSGIFR